MSRRFRFPTGTSSLISPVSTPPADSSMFATTAGLAFVAGGLLAVGSVAGPIRLVDPITLVELVASTRRVVPRKFSRRSTTGMR